MNHQSTACRGAQILSINHRKLNMIRLFFKGCDSSVLVNYPGSTACRIFTLSTGEVVQQVFVLLSFNICINSYICKLDNCTSRLNTFIGTNPDFQLTFYPLTQISVTYGLMDRQARPLFYMFRLCQMKMTPMSPLETATEYF